MAYAASGLLIALTLAVVLPVLRAEFRQIPNLEPAAQLRGEVAARVGDAVLYREDIALLDLTDEMVHEWSRTELLALTAVAEGLEDPAISRFVQQRARQLYLSDLLLERVAASLDYPSAHEAMAYMELHPEEFLLERHYFHILLADSATADSIHQRLSGGELFSHLAERVSLSQKAALGGDLGFLTGGELFFAGMPREMASLEGLSPIFSTENGWHILHVSETRPLEDSSRAVSMVREYLFKQRFETALESIVSDAAQRYDCEVNL
jgi:hypothetical protein